MTQTQKLYNPLNLALSADCPFAPFRPRKARETSRSHCWRDRNPHQLHRQARADLLVRGVLDDMERLDRKACELMAQIHAVDTPPTIASEVPSGTKSRLSRMRLALVFTHPVFVMSIGAAAVVFRKMRT